MNILEKIIHAGSIELQALLDVVRHGFPDIMLQFGGGIGDELLLTAVAHEIKKRKQSVKIWQVSHSPELLRHNPDYAKVFSMEHWPLRYSIMMEPRRQRLSYAIETEPRKAEIPPKIHIIAELCRKAGVHGEISIKPYFFFHRDEIISGVRTARQIAVQCVGINSYTTIMRNKLWDTAKFQVVIDQMREIYPALTIIQVGSDHDYPLEGVIDRRGKTSIRETAGILSRSEVFIGTAGFLMHLARAVDCRSVIIYGGREHSWQSGYICNENLNSFVKCAPCWKWDECNDDRRCMNMVQPEDVVRAAGRILERSNEPLEVEKVQL
ncbi:MAG: glycosyltransferase family 9 protein [Dissulfurispiraceae bacterium]